MFIDAIQQSPPTTVQHIHATRHEANGKAPPHSAQRLCKQVGRAQDKRGQTERHHHTPHKGGANKWAALKDKRGLTNNEAEDDEDDDDDDQLLLAKTALSGRGY